MTPSGPATTAAAPVPNQRTRILQAALGLMGQRGAHTMSMRQLAAACDLNVATLYHYFPSKAALLQAVLEDKRYLDQLADTAPKIDAHAAPRERLAGMLRWFLERVVEEEATWRLILGESLRGERVALDTVTDLSTAIAGTIEVWLRQHFPELDVRSEVAARAVRDQVLAFCVEGLTLGPGDRGRRIEERAEDLAALLFGGQTSTSSK